MIPKFRAWIKTEKRMIETDDLLDIDYENEVITTQQVYFENGLPDDRDLDNFVFEEIKLMQSTGLVDKNGKEIFEGDIVQFEDCYEVSDFLYINTGIIEWCQGGFHITNRDSVLMEDLLDGDSLDVTIIGNIYENPELLEDKE